MYPYYDLWDAQQPEKAQFLRKVDASFGGSCAPSFYGESSWPRLCIVYKALVTLEIELRARIEQVKF